MARMISRGRVLGALLGGATLLSAQPAVSQSSEPETADESLGDIVVTARKRAENLQDTPVSITALNAQALEDRSIVALSDLDGFVPNAEITSGAGNSGSPGFASFFVRGIGQTDSIITSDPGVGLYVDGVYLARSPGSVLDLLDIERIEVLRGPQGTLFGKNTIGGAISVVTRAPSFEPEGRIEATVGRFGRAELRGYASGPLSDEVAVKIAGAYKYLDGYGRRLDVATGDAIADTGALDDLILRGGLLWRAGESLSIDLGVDYTRNRDSSVPQTLLVTNPAAPVLFLYNALVGGPGGTPVTPALAQPGRFDSFATGGNESNQDVYGIRATISYDFGRATLKSITAWRSLESFAANDGDGSPAVLLSSLYDLDQEQVSQEFQLSGTGAGDRLNWLVGGYFLRETASEFFDGRVASGLFTALESLPAAVIPLAPGAMCPAPFPAPCAGGAGNPFNSALEVDFLSLNQIETDSYALFAQATYAFSDLFSVTAGLRQTREDKSLLNVFRRKRLSGVPVIPADTSFEASFDSLSPKLGIELEPSDDVLLYASVSQGFKSGGFNGRALTPGAFGSFSPEKVWAYEAGLKTEMLDRRIRFNSALFYNDYTDIQLTQESANPDGSIDIRVVNAGTVHMKGFESEVQARPFAGFDLNAAIGFIDADYRRIAPGVPIALGNDLPFVSKWTVSAGAQYRFALGDAAALTLRADYAYRSRFFVDAANSPALRQPGYELLSARATLSSADDRWAVALFGTNLTDEDYLTGGLDTTGALGVVQLQKGGRPREWGATLRYSF